MIADVQSTNYFKSLIFFTLILKRLATSVMGAVIIIYSLAICSTADAGNQSPDLSYNFGKGPFSLTSNSPSPSLRLTAPPIVPSNISPGGVDIGFGTSWTNVWANELSYLFDFEMLDSHLSITYGISKRWMVGIAFNQRAYFGGSMDNFIIEFHDLLGIDQDGRNEAPTGKSRLLLLDRNGNTVTDLGTADIFNNSSIKLMSSYILYSGTDMLPAVNLSGVVQYGLETPFADDDDPFDISIGIGFSKRWSARWYSYHTLNYTHYSQTDMPHLKFEDNSFSATNTLAWEKGPSLSFLLQYMYHEGVIKDLGSLSDATHELSLGFKWQIRKKGIIEFGVIENIIDYANSPDFGVHAAYSHAFH
jgi:Protein of unknown function (DUF3187)